MAFNVLLKRLCLGPTRTYLMKYKCENASFLRTHRFINPTACATLLMDTLSSLARSVHIHEATEENGVLNSYWKPLLVLSSHKKKLGADQNGALPFNGYFPSLDLSAFSLNYRGKMPSIPFNALSESSLMSCTYPPTTKLSKHLTPVDESKPITWKEQKRSLLFNKCSSSPSLHLGHRCRHCGSLHLWVSSH